MRLISKKIFFLLCGLIILIILIVGILFGITLHKHLQNECLKKESINRISKDCSDVL